MAITRATGFPTGDTATAASLSPTVSITTQKVGDLVVLYFVGAVGESLSAISGGGVSGWKKATDINNVADAYMAQWWGVVTTVGTANATLTISAATAGRANLDSLTGGQGWALENAGTLANASSATVTWPSVTATRNAEAYLGLASIATTGAAGSTTGFTYTLETSGGVLVANLNVTKGAVQPTATESPAGVSTTVGAIFSVNSYRQAGAQQAVQRAATRMQAWRRRRSGIVVPDCKLWRPAGAVI